MPTQFLGHPQETHQLTLTPFTPPVAAREAARASRLAHNNSAISRLSTRPPGRPRSTIDSGRATNKGLGTAPEYEHDHRREPADTRTAPQATTTFTPTTTTNTMAINPYPLTTAPPYGRHSGRPDSAVRAPRRALPIAQQQSSDPPRRDGCLCHDCDHVVATTTSLLVVQSRSVKRTAREARTTDGAERDEARRGDVRGAGRDTGLCRIGRRQDRWRLPRATLTRRSGSPARSSPQRGVWRRPQGSSASEGDDHAWARVKQGFCSAACGLQVRRRRVSVRVSGARLLPPSGSKRGFELESALFNRQSRHADRQNTIRHSSTVLTRPSAPEATTRASQELTDGA